LERSGAGRPDATLAAVVGVDNDCEAFVRYRARKCDSSARQRDEQEKRRIERGGKSFALDRVFVVEAGVLEMVFV
jgi:hypothetical protein